MDFKKDDLVTHAIFGFGKITNIDEKESNVQIAFGRQGIKWLSLKHAKLQKISADEYETLQNNYNKQYENWPVSTFFHELENKEHSFQNRWDSFVENQSEILNKLPELYNEAIAGTGFGVFYASPIKEPTDWQIGFQRNYPNQNCGLSVLCAIKADGNYVANYFPFHSSGTQLNLKLQRVDVWNTGLEAQITASWGDAKIKFFDTRFIHDRAWYVADRSYEFILTGIVYFANLSKLGDVKFKHSPEVVAKLKELTADNPEFEGMSDELSFSDLAIFLPIEGFDTDDYQFHAPIKSIKSIDDFLGQKCWEAVVTVMRNIVRGIDDADLKIIITERAWHCDEPPQVGQYIEGALWLQGYLWNVPEKESF